MEIVGAAIFGIASLTDWLDGYLARRRKQVTTLGQLLDPLADKLLITAALLSLVQMDIAPAWMVLVILGREFAVTVLRGVAYSRGVVIAASPLGKLKMVSQVVAILLLILGYDHLQRFFVLGRIALWVAVFSQWPRGSTITAGSTTSCGQGADRCRRSLNFLGRLVRDFSLEQLDSLLRLGQVLALLELLDDAIEVGQGQGRLVGLGVAVAHVEIHGVAVRELRVLLEQRLEPIDGARAPARPVVVIADVVFVLAQAIARLAQPRLALFELRIVGIALDKDREFLDGFARLGLIAVGAVHLLEMRHPELELRVAGARLLFG